MKNSRPKGPAAASWPSRVARADGMAQSVDTWRLQRFDTPQQPKMPDRLRAQGKLEAIVETLAYERGLRMTACLHWPLHRH